MGALGSIWFWITYVVGCFIILLLTGIGSAEDDPFNNFEIYHGD